MAVNQVETHINVQVTDRNRATVFFRGILVFPMVIFLASLSSATHIGMYASGIVMVPVLLTLLFRGKYPSYILTFNHAIIELNTRVTAYALFLVDDYPSIERNQNIAVMFPDVEHGRKLSRGLPLVKWLFAIPLYIVGAFYTVIAVLLTIFAWLHTSVTGTYPGTALNWVVGTVGYWNRVAGYTALLVTDDYPSFSLSGK